MTKIKQFGEVYTPDFIVSNMLDFGNYYGEHIIAKHVIDNSCGEGAFLSQIVKRYCTYFLDKNQHRNDLKEHLSEYIHGIEIDKDALQICIANLDRIVAEYGIKSIKWDIRQGNTLNIDLYNGKMDFIFGNPPYVRVHNLSTNYQDVKKYHFAKNGMTDLYIVFFEVGFKMLNSNGIMCLITPSSWLSSKAGEILRKYIFTYKNLTKLVDLKHFQPFNATTYTLISLFSNKKSNTHIEYYSFDEINLRNKFENILSYQDCYIRDKFYLAKHDQLKELKNIYDTSLNCVIVKKWLCYFE